MGSTLPTLPSLDSLVDIPTPLAPARPSESVIPADPNAVTQGASSAEPTAINSGLFGQFETWLTTSTANIVAVVIGIVLIAGAVWGFDQVRDTITSTAKGAAEIAAS